MTSNLYKLIKNLKQNGLKVVLSSNDSLKLIGDIMPSTELESELKAEIKIFKSIFLERLKSGQTFEGVFSWDALGSMTGICGTCRHWDQHRGGSWLGDCGHQRTSGIHAAHQCDVQRWRAKSSSKL